MSITIKEDTLASLKRYVDQRIETGGFLRAVLENDLMGAFGKADLQNRAALFEITSYVYNHMPSNCHGSKEIVDQWLGE